jgi:Protein of unknown function (DUF1488)
MIHAIGGDHRSWTSPFRDRCLYFYMSNDDQRVRCGITGVALELLEPELPHTKQGRIQAFNRRRARIERSASEKFDRGALEPDGRTVLVRAFDLM